MREQADAGVPNSPPRSTSGDFARAKYPLLRGSSTAEQILTPHQMPPSCKFGSEPEATSQLKALVRTGVNAMQLVLPFFHHGPVFIGRLLRIVMKGLFARLGSGNRCTSTRDFHRGMKVHIYSRSVIELAQRNEARGGTLLQAVDPASAPEILSLPRKLHFAKAAGALALPRTVARLMARIKTKNSCSA